MDEEMPIAMLKKDHRKVEELFAECHQTDDQEERTDIVKKIVKELEVHMELEEQLFYPEVESFSDEGEQLARHAKREHQEMREMLSELKSKEMLDEDDNEMIKRLEMSKSDHVRDEEQKMFPFAEENMQDELGIGLSAKMIALKQKLKLQM